LTRKTGATYSSCLRGKIEFGDGEALDLFAKPSRRSARAASKR
jgi:hypothetical protein